MGSEVPKPHLRLRAGSVADELSYIALADLSDALGAVQKPEHCRLIGGHMVTLLANRWDLGAGLFRETKYADVGVHKVALVSGEVVSRLQARGYEQKAGNRFGRTPEDLDIDVSNHEEAPALVAMIDLLIPSYDSRIRDSVPVGDIVTTEVPGLANALARDPVVLALDVVRLNGDCMNFSVLVPDESSALIRDRFSSDK